MASTTQGMLRLRDQKAIKIMKSKLIIAMVALAIGAGSLKAGDWGEFNRQQAEWQAAMDRQRAVYEQQEAQRAG
jgi:hypothetical protein